MNGLKSLHPKTRELLKSLGFIDSDVMQGWGGAPASAGFHLPESTRPKFSSCFDLRWDSVRQGHRDKLVAASVCVFPRDWPGNRHHHCVQIGLTNNAGKCTILPGPRTQIRDFFSGRNGLAGHAAWTGKWAPTGAEKRAIVDAYGAWVPDIATEVRVHYPGDAGRPVTVPCYAWIEVGKTVCCEVRALVEGLGGRILEATFSGLTVRTADGATVPVSFASLAYLAGEFLRAPVRPIAEAMGYEVGFEWAPGKASCVVRLTKPGVS